MRGKCAKRIKKNKKKSKATDCGQALSLDLLCNVQGLTPKEEQTEDDLLGVFDTNIYDKNNQQNQPHHSLESCLDELDSFEKTSDNNDNYHYGDSDNSNINMAKKYFGSGLSMLWREENDRIDKMKTSGIRKQSMQINQRNKDTFRIPVLKVELARHFHMGKISKYFLRSCPNLRMPSLERWIFDCKIEEKQKNINNQSAYIDPVIPSTAQINDDPSQRLLQEIQVATKDIKKSKNKSITTTKSDYEKEDPEQICQHLCHMATSASRHLQNLSSHLKNNAINSTTIIPWAKSNGETIVLEGYDDGIGCLSSDEGKGTGKNGNNKAVYALVYSRRMKKRKRSDTNSSSDKNNKPFVVKINASHYEKLRYMYNATHCENNQDGEKTRPPWYVTAPSERVKDSKEHAAKKLFHHLVFALLLRYSSQAGGQLLHDLRGGGMQGAIHTHVFDFIRDQAVQLNKEKSNSNENHFNVKECFASPLNAYLGNQYASAFSQDLDWHFGSRGDFFFLSSTNNVDAFYSNKTILEANPPFSPGVMNAMATRIEEILDTASSQNKNIIFMIIVPTCHKSSTNIVQSFAKSSFNLILHSKYFVKSFTIHEREHGYVEGSQHIRPTRYKESPYDTSFLILQSKTNDGSLNTAFQALINSKSFITGLKKSFASLHVNEMEQRQEQIHRKSGTKLGHNKQELIKKIKLNSAKNLIGKSENI